MRIFLLAVVALVVAACSQGDNAATPQAEAQHCDGAARTNWDIGPAGPLTISAVATGDTCAQALAVLRVTNARNDILFEESYQSDRVMVLAGATDPANLQAKLREWIGTAPSTSSTLPDWPMNAPQPSSGEFPFYPNEEITREAYLETRTANAPMWCFVQGMESLACLVLRDDRLIDLGAQSFPG